jgi:hypothetical protein
MVVLTEWTCATPSCGHKLANRVVVQAGWIERKCHRCPAVAHVGDARGRGAVVRWLKCSTPGCRKNAAEVSVDWRGALTYKCRWCRQEVTLSVA